MGGLPTHPCRGLPCTIGWELSTNPNYVIVYFEHDPRKLSESAMQTAKKLGLNWKDISLGSEICNKDNLVPVE